MHYKKKNVLLLFLFNNNIISNKMHFKNTHYSFWISPYIYFVDDECTRFVYQRYKMSTHCMCVGKIICGCYEKSFFFCIVVWSNDDESHGNYTLRGNVKNDRIK